jgi:DNA-binding NarL/FixJ family response regulator
VTIKIVTVSSNTFVQLGLRQTFDAHPSVTVVGECPPGSSVRDVVEEERPDLIVVDLESDMNQLDIGMLRQCAPEARIVVLSGWSDMERGRRALEMGADVIMMKCQPASLLLAIIESMAKGQAAPTSQTRSLLFKHERGEAQPARKDSAPSARMDSSARACPTAISPNGCLFPKRPSAIISPASSTSWASRIAKNFSCW